MSVMQNNVFVHSNPPKAVSGSGFNIRQWVKNGDVDKLEAYVLEGQGARLLGLAEATGDSRVRNFLRSVPGLMAKVDQIHDTVTRGSLRETQALLDKKKLATARDAVGRGLPHKAVLCGNKAVLEWLSKKYPETLNLRDNEGRTPLHYSAGTRDVEDTYKLLVNLGASPDILDLHGHRPMYYVEHPEELDIEGGPSPSGGGAGTGGVGTGSTGRSLSRGKRRRISPISNSHSPRKFIISPVGTLANGLNSITSNISSYFSQQSSPPSVSRAQIRIWIHEKDIPKLERIVWSGNGDKLLLETSNNSKVRRFLDNVPHLLSRIKQVHAATINNDVESLKEMRRRTDVVEIFKSQDSHGLTPLHKAAGLSHRAVLEYLIYEFPDLINVTDREGRGPLYYSAKDQNLYSFLMKAGADEGVVDSRGKTPSYYRAHPAELDTRYLRLVPDAPRVSGDLLGWDRDGTGTAATSSHTTASLGNQSQHGHNRGREQRSSSDEFSLGEEGNMIISETTGKYDLENVDVEIREDELRVGDDDEDDFEMEEARIEEDTRKMNGVATQAEALIDAHGFRVDKPGSKTTAAKSSTKTHVRTGSIAQKPSAPPPPAYEEQQRQWPMNETVEMINEEPEQQQQPKKNAISNSNSQKKQSIGAASKSTLVSKQAPSMAEKGKTKSTGSVGAGRAVVNGEEVEARKEVELYNDSPYPYPHAYQETVNLRNESDDESDKRGHGQHGQGISDEPPPEHQYQSLGAEGEDDEIETALRNRDMETLVEKILQGEGSLLMNRSAPHPDVQEFLNNVPAYMTKIGAIHSAAAAGSLRDLQTLLDRKRLAMARDEHGRGPLHQAVLHNHVNVAKHLANTYPQTLRLLDHNGRSALHYASTLADSGQMYKYLVNWGADPNVKDALNNTPGVYLRNRDLLSLKELMEGTSGTGAAEGAPPAADRGSSKSTRSKKQNQETTTAAMAASAVSAGRPNGGPPRGGADAPMERWERPKTPDVSVLSALDTFYETILLREDSFWTRAWRKLTTSTQGNVQVKLMVSKYLNRQLFDAMKRFTTSSGATLMDVLKFYPQFFIVAPDPEAYDVWRALFIPTLSDVMRIGVGLGSGVAGYVFGDHDTPAQLPVCEIPVVDVPSKYVKLVRMRLSRNIVPFPFLPQMKREDMNRVSNVLKTVKLNWPCFDLEVLDKETRQSLEQICWLPDVSKVSRFWPKARYFLLSHDYSVQIWINAEDHLDVIVQSKYGKLYPMLETVNDVYLLYAKKFAFYRNDEFGYLTVDPLRCGTGLKITFRIRLPTLMQDRADLTTLATELNLNLRWKHNRIATSASKSLEIAPDDWVEVENVTTLGLNEFELCQSMCTAMEQLIAADQERARILAMIEAANKNKK